MLVFDPCAAPASIAKAVVFSILFGPVAAVWACEGVDTALTEARKHEYKKLVSAATDGKAAPASVSVSAFMKSGDWSAVYASTEVSDDGVFFFRDAGGSRQFKDVWGGVADESERGELVAWAEKLGAPGNLARCFADAVID